MPLEYPDRQLLRLAVINHARSAVAAIDAVEAWFAAATENGTNASG